MGESEHPEVIEGMLRLIDIDILDTDEVCE